MLLSLLDNSDSITLPNDLLWEDEFDWTPVAAKESTALTGALIVEVSARLAGRPISLKAPDNEMGWVTRAVAAKLLAWASVPGRKLTLTFQYPDDTRSFTVMFRQSANAIKMSPVRGFPGHADGDFFVPSLQFIQV